MTNSAQTPLTAHPGPAVPDAPARTARPWWTLVAVSVGSTMVGLDGTALTIASPDLARDLNASISDLQWIVNAYLLALAVALIPAGWLADRYGRRLVFLAGVIGFAATSLAIGLSSSVDVVIALRAAQGVAGALLQPAALALLRAAFPPQRLEIALGVWGGAAAVAIAAGPIVGGVLVAAASWHAIFFLNLPVGAVAVALTLWTVKESKAGAETTGRWFDFLGMVLLTGALLSLIGGVTLIESTGWLDLRPLGLLAAAVVLLALFVARQRRAPAPLLPPRLFQTRTLNISAVLVGLSFFVLFGVVFFSTLFLQNVRGLDPITAGAWLLPLTASLVVSAPMGGALTSRFGPRLPLVLATLLIAAGAAGMTTLTKDSSFLAVALPTLPVGLGGGTALVAATHSILDNAPAELAGTASAVQQIAGQIGGLFGIATLGSALSGFSLAALPGLLDQARLPGPVLDYARENAGLVAQGVVPAPPGVTPEVLSALTEAAHGAFVEGMRGALWLTAAVAVLSAGLALFTRRRTTP